MGFKDLYNRIVYDSNIGIISDVLITTGVGLDSLTNFADGKPELASLELILAAQGFLQLKNYFELKMGFKKTAESHGVKYLDF